MFQNPWAWLGLAAIAAPILVHLLARQPARRLPFPTLRFLPPARLAPIRRGRLSDVALLLVRCGVLAFAVAALAQPDWSRTHPVTRTAQPELARAVLVDTSWSVAHEAARREAEGLRATATTARIVETPAPVTALAAATNWLTQQSTRRELVLVSDFQTGTIEREDLALVPADIGIKLVRIEPRAPPALARTDAATSPAVRLLASSTGQEGAEAARRAAETRGAPARGRTDRTVTIVFPDFDRRGALLAAARPPDQPWMFDVITRVLGGDQAHLYREGLTWSAAASSTSELQFFASVAAGSLGSAALISAAARAASDDPEPAELSATPIADATLRAWERPASDVTSPPGGDPDRFDGRWMWGLALVLLALEAWMRRTPRSPMPVEMSHERAA